jgi:hypothetical protein
MPKDLLLLKFSGDNGVRLAALCRPKEGMGVLRDVLGEDEESEEWMQHPDDSVVAIATEGLVTVRDSEDLMMLSWWLAMAATWLKSHGG